MILMKLLENDLHRGKKGVDVTPYMIEVPARSDFVPAIVSSTRGKFLTSRKLTDENRIRVGVFECDSEKLDAVLPDLMDAAHRLSKQEGWDNVFVGDGSASHAFKHIRSHSELSGQPHVCLVPNEWETDGILAWLKRRKWDPVMKYKKCCRIVTCNVNTPIFCSRPDYVGMITHFMGNPTGVGILLHNIRKSLAFCDVGN
jgi:hypothetical protein